MASVFDILMGGGLTAYEENLPTKEVEVKRLSEVCGEKVVFTLTALTLSQIDKVREESEEENFDVLCCAYGIKDPSLRSAEWSDKLGLSHFSPPAKVIRALLSPGEIQVISREIQSLSGYQKDVLADVEKN